MDSNIPIASLPAGPIETPNWSTVIDAEASSDGSNGVVFVLTSQGAYIIKSSNRPGEEYFASHILTALSIRAPKIRIVSHKQPEFRQIKNAIRDGAEARRRRGDPSGATRVESRLKGPLYRPQLLVMEVISDALPLVGHPRAGGLLDPPSGDPSLSEQKSRLHTLGRILAMDIFLNNSDRVSLGCWDNDGNGGNLLLQEQDSLSSDGNNRGGRTPTLLIPIDNVVTTLRPETSKSLLSQYVGRARKTLTAFCHHRYDDKRNDHNTQSEIETVRQFVYNNTGHRLSEGALYEISSGARQGLVDIVHYLSSNRDLMQNCLDQCAAAVDVDWQDVWRKSIACVHIPFFHTMLTMFEELVKAHARHLPPASDSVNTIGTIHLDDKQNKDYSTLSERLKAALPEGYQIEVPVTQDDERKFNSEQGSFTTNTNLSREDRNKRKDLMVAIRTEKQNMKIISSPAQRSSNYSESDRSGSTGATAGFQKPPSLLASIQAMAGKSRKKTEPSRKTPAATGASANELSQKNSKQNQSSKGWRTREGAMSRTAADLFAQRHCCGASNLHLLRPNDSLGGILPLLDADGTTLGNTDSGKSHSTQGRDPVVVAFDFDQTITEPKRQGESRSNPKVRGGQSSMEALKQLAQRKDVELVIVTATKPSRQNASAIAAEVRCLGLGDAFEVENDYADKLLAYMDKQCVGQGGETLQLNQLTARDLTARLISLLATARDSDRVGADLWRIDSDSIAVDVTGATASFSTRRLSPVQEENIFASKSELGHRVHSVKWVDLKSGLSKPQKLCGPADGSPDVVSVLAEYCRRTKPFRSVTPETEPLLLDVSSDGANFLPSAMPPSVIESLLTEYSVAAGLSPREIGCVIDGESTIARTKAINDGDVVPLATCGRIICANYNKPEAVRWFISSRKILPRRVIFVDDNPANVLSMFLDVGKKLSKDLAPEETKHREATGRVCWPTDAIWFKPPAHGKSESVDPSVADLVADISLRSVLPLSMNAFTTNCDAHLQKATPRPSSVLALLLQHASPTDAAVGASVVEEALNSAKAKISSGQPGQRKIRLVVLPENFVQEKVSFLRQPHAESRLPPEFHPYSEVAVKHEVYIVCGTANEPVPNGNGKHFKTCVVLGPDGQMVGTYRKRRIHNVVKQCPGTQPLVFDAGPEIGRVGILICLDAEDPTLVEELQGLGVRVVVNPTNIPPPTGETPEQPETKLSDQLPFPSSSATDDNNAENVRYRDQWRMALMSMQRRFEWRCSSIAKKQDLNSGSGELYLLRCDQPRPKGMGTSQVIGPIMTTTVASMHTEGMLVEIPSLVHSDEESKQKSSTTPTSSLGPLMALTPESSYVRTHSEDNTGARTRVKQTCVSTGGILHVARLRFVYPQSTANPTSSTFLIVHLKQSRRGDCAVGNSNVDCVAVIDTNKLSINYYNASNVHQIVDPDVRMNGRQLLSEISSATSPSTTDGEGGEGDVVGSGEGGMVCSGWIDKERNTLIGVYKGQLQLFSRAAEFRKEADGENNELCFVGRIPFPEAISGLAIDHLAGGLATATAGSTDNKNQSALISLWSFSHNNVSAPLADFLFTGN